MDRLGELLIKKGLISRDQLKEALALQRKIGGRMGKVLQKLGYIDEDHFSRFLAEEYGHPYLTFEEIRPDEKLIARFPLDLMRQKQFFPLKRSAESLAIALVDPTDIETEDQLAFQESRPVAIHVVSERTVERVLRAVFHKDEPAASPSAREGGDEDRLLHSLMLQPERKLAHALLKTLVDRKILTAHEIAQKLKEL